MLFKGPIQIRQSNQKVLRLKLSSPPLFFLCALPGTHFEYVCEPKVDGLGVALLYERGRFIRGALRMIQDAKIRLQNSRK